MRDWTETRTRQLRDEIFGQPGFIGGFGWGVERRKWKKMERRGFYCGFLI